jgi:hypothetical protein
MRDSKYHKGPGRPRCFKERKSESENESVTVQNLELSKNVFNFISITIKHFLLPCLV